MVVEARRSRFVGSADDMQKARDPLCLTCVHLDRSDVGAMKCTAYSGGIPAPIIAWEWDHHNPLPGDNGIQYQGVL